MSRPLMIVGNWKMHKTIEEAMDFMKNFSKAIPFGKGDVYLAPPFTAISSVVEKAKEHGIHIGAQSVSNHVEGPYTGEISARMVQELGATFSLVGHSERRSHHFETNEIVSEKIKRCLDHGLKPILCIGETGIERSTNKTHHVLEKQVGEAVHGLRDEQVASIAIAYEPVWAIGTGHTATAEMAQQAHKLCRDFIKKIYNGAIADRIPILYGGSVNVKTIEELIKQPDIDGALVGGASLEVDSFVKIITISRECKS